MFRLTKKRFESEEELKRGVSKFDMSYRSTRLCNEVTKKTVKLQFYDTNIEDLTQYAKLCSTYLTLCHGVIFVYNTIKKTSFFNCINKWLQLLKRRNPDYGSSYSVFMVGTHTDVANKRLVVKEEAEEMAENAKVSIFELNLKERDDKVYNCICQTIAHTLSQRVLNKDSQFVPKDITKQLLTDDRIVYFQKKPVCIIPPFPEPDLKDYMFDSDDEKNFKVDEDEVRLQKEFGIRADEQVTSMATGSSSTTSGTNSELQNPSKTSVTTTGSDSISTVDSTSRNPQFTAELQEMKKNEVEVVDQFSPAIKSEGKPLTDEFDMMIADITEQDLQFLDENRHLDYGIDWRLSSLKPVDEYDDFVNGFLKKEEQTTFDSKALEPQRDHKPKLASVDRVIATTERVDAIQQKQQKGKLKNVDFDFTEAKITLQLQILGLAKRLRDDVDLNEMFSSEEKVQLKQAIRTAYEALTRAGGISSAEKISKTKVLETVCNNLILAANSRYDQQQQQQQQHQEEQQRQNPPLANGNSIETSPPTAILITSK